MNFDCQAFQCVSPVVPALAQARMLEQLPSTLGPGLDVGETVKDSHGDDEQTKDGGKEFDEDLCEGEEEEKLAEGEEEEDAEDDKDVD